MKKIISLFCAVIICVASLCLQVAAETPEFTLDMGNDYIYFRKGDDLKRAAEITGTSVKELEKVFDDENLVMLALSKDNERQIKVAYYQNSLSEKIGDLSAMETEDIRELSKELYTVNESSVVDVIEMHAENAKYMCFSELLSDSGGDYIAAQYLTVVDGYFWHITTYGPNHNNVAVILPYFTIGSNGSSTLSKVLHISGIVFALFTIVMLVIYIIEHRKEKAICSACDTESEEIKEESDAKLSTDSEQ